MWGVDKMWGVNIHFDYASHFVYASHFFYASHFKYASHFIYDSHLLYASHFVYASHFDTFFLRDQGRQTDTETDDWREKMLSFWTQSPNEWLCYRLLFLFACPFSFRLPQTPKYCISSWFGEYSWDLHWIKKARSSQADCPPDRFKFSFWCFHEDLYIKRTSLGRISQQYYGRHPAEWVGRWHFTWSPGVSRWNRCKCFSF